MSTEFKVALAVGVGLGLVVGVLALWMAWDNRKAAWATDRLVRMHSQDTEELPPLGKVRLGDLEHPSPREYLDAHSKRQGGRRNH